MTEAQPMRDENGRPEEEAAAPVLAAGPDANAVEFATVNAGIATVRADISEVRAHLSALKGHAVALKADLTEEKAGVTEVMSDLIRLNQKVDRLAAALADAQSDVERIFETMATKNDVARILGAIDAAAKKL